MKRPAITDRMKLDVLRNHQALVRCAACGTVMPAAAAQYDHIQALVDGGAHTVENLRPICATCHAAKSAREHKANAKAKRLARERAGLPKRARPKRPIRSAGFRKDVTRGFNGKVRPRG